MPRRPPVEVTESVDVAAPPSTVYATLVDWPAQSEWMLLTHVRVTRGTGTAVGDKVEARTGVGPVAVPDSMTITGWDPPRRCTVLHTGRAIRGTGTFDVADLGGGRSRLSWTERLDLPLGALGRLGWPLARPVVVAGLRLSLRRFASYAPRRVAP